MSRLLRTCVHVCVCVYSISTAVTLTSSPPSCYIAPRAHTASVPCLSPPSGQSSTLITGALIKPWQAVSSNISHHLSAGSRLHLCCRRRWESEEFGEMGEIFRRSSCRSSGLFTFTLIHTEETSVLKKGRTKSVWRYSSDCGTLLQNWNCPCSLSLKKRRPRLTFTTDILHSCTIAPTGPSQEATQCDIWHWHVPKCHIKTCLWSRFWPFKKC